MKEKLIIKNFGPIKDVELELGRFNILIGEQATGKSTIAKVLAACRYFSYIIEGDDFYFKQPFEDGLIAWGLNESIQENTYISYTCKHYSLIVKRILKEKFYEDENGNLHPYGLHALETKLTPLSKEFNHLLIELNKIKPPRPIGRGFGDIGWTIPYSFFLNDVKTVLDNPFYLPTERGLQSVFSLGQASIPNLASFLYKYFSKVDGILRFFNKETEIEPLNIIYINVNGIGYIKKKNEKVLYLLFNAASGYQSTIPAVLVMKFYNEKKRKKTFIIEEPELNLFPTAQNKLMQYLVDKTVNFGNSMLVTTQSPYILTSLNNMMYAYQIGKINPEKVSGIIDKKYWLNPDDVSAYILKSDGTVENIIDNEGLIKAEEIDEVSKAINKEFNNIMDIELGVDEESK